MLNVSNHFTVNTTLEYKIENISKIKVLSITFKKYKKKLRFNKMNQNCNSTFMRKKKVGK